MEKINVGILGYGNLGQALESLLKGSEKFNLVVIFSFRAEQLSSRYNSLFDKPDNMEQYKDKIDTIFLCGSSFNKTEEQILNALKYFNTIDSFDKHAKLEAYIKNADDAARLNGKIALTACGWDPGIVSVIRLLFNCIDNTSSAAVFWGAGISQGHSNALRQLEGITNAVQYTIPNKKELKKCSAAFNYCPPSNDKHSRLCFVSLKKGFKKREIKNQILNIPDYFYQQKVLIKFVSEQKIKTMQQKLSHKCIVFKNFVISDLYKTRLKFNLELESNPHFTAHVMLMMTNAVNKLQILGNHGAHSIFDIPLSYLSPQTSNKLIKEYL